MTTIEDGIFDKFAALVADVDGSDDALFSSIYDELRGTSTPNAEKLAAIFRSAIGGDLV